METFFNNKVWYKKYYFVKKMYIKEPTFFSWQIKNQLIHLPIYKTDLKLKRKTHPIQY